MENSFLNAKPLQVFVILAETLEGWINPTSEEGKIVLAKHYSWGTELKNNGKLILAGPTNFDKIYASDKINPIGITTGLIMLCASTIEEAEELAYKDPFHIYGYRKNVVHAMKITATDTTLFSILEKIINKH